MTRAPQLRAFLCENGYRITRERLAAEPGRVYVILEAFPEGAACEGAACEGAACKGAAYSAAELEIGRFGPDEDPALVRAHVRARLASLSRKRGGLVRGGAPPQPLTALESLMRACEEEYHDFI